MLVKKSLIVREEKASNLKSVQSQTTDQLGSEAQHVKNALYLDFVVLSIDGRLEHARVRLLAQSS